MNPTCSCISFNINECLGKVGFVIQNDDDLNGRWFEFSCESRERVSEASCAGGKEEESKKTTFPTTLEL